MRLGQTRTGSILSKILIFSVIAALLMPIVFFQRSAAALSKEQKNIYNKNILYFDLEACSGVNAAAETKANDKSETSDSTQELAKQMLANKKIIYWTNKGVNTRDVVVALSKGKKAYTTAANAPNKDANLNPNILKFIIEVGKTKKIMVNALTDKTHSSSTSNHYKGLAVDLDSKKTEASVSELNTIAKKYGGDKNTETSHHHYDFTSKTSSRQESGVVAAATTEDNQDSLYMLGDSIALGAKKDLEAKFKQNGINSVYISGSVSRTIDGKGTSAGQKTSGLEAVNKDKNRLKRAGVVIIALGTNPEPNFKDQIKKLVEKIKGTNSGAKLYWVNVFSTGGNSDKKASNKAIDDLASDQGYSVIDLSNVDIELEKDNFHPTPGNGNRSYAAAVTAGIGTQSSQDNPSAKPGECKCQKGDGAALSGAGNAGKIWNYFIGKGLKPVQVAGMLGNIKVESNFNPRSLQPSTTGDFPVPGQGYGLVQWTDRHANLIRRSKEKNVKIYDLAFQIDHIWWELNNPEKAAFTDFKKQTTLEGAWKSFSHKYERPAAPNNPERGKAAKDALAKFGSSGGSAESGEDEDASVCTGKDEESASGKLTIKKLKPFLPGASSGGNIKPKGITLHWWSEQKDKGINGLVDIFKSNGLSVQVGITSDGEVWQLTRSLTTKTSHAVGGNATTIGIEIEGGPEQFGADGVRKYPKKFDAVVKTVQYLIDKYNIPIKKSPVCNDASGVLQHSDFNKCPRAVEKSDIDDYYYNAVIDKLR